MKISIIGPTNIPKLTQITGKSEEFFLERAEKLGDILAQSKSELWVNYDKGMLDWVASSYKRHKGAKLVVLSASTGVPWPNEHIKGYRKHADQLREEENWLWANYNVVSQPDICICVGLSAGTLSELAYIKWNQQFSAGNLKQLIGVRELLRDGKFPPEIEIDTKDIVTYVDTVEDIEGIFKGRTKGETIREPKSDVRRFSAKPPIASSQMQHVLDFLLQIGKLKNIQRKGMTFYGVDILDTAADHTFRTAMMVWTLGGGKNINLEKAIKIALVHNLCKIHAGDITPYDDLLPKDKKERDKFVRRWRRLPLAEKKKRNLEKVQKEQEAIAKLTKKLPLPLKEEVQNLWQEYRGRSSPEARFVHQLNTTENLLEALEYRKKTKKFPTEPWWEHADEVIDDPVLLDFLHAIEKEELKGK